MEIGAYAAERGSRIAVETGPEALDTLSSFIDDCGPASPSTTTPATS
jgi:hypothetical protein